MAQSRPLGRRGGGGDGGVIGDPERTQTGRVLGQSHGPGRRTGLAKRAKEARPVLPLFNGRIFSPTASDVSAAPSLRPPARCCVGSWELARSGARPPSALGCS